MEKIGIVGLGLIGASIAKALKGKYDVVGVDSDKDAIGYCLENGIISDCGLGSLRGCSVVFLSVPVSAVERTARQVHIVVGEDTVITDTASVKNCFSGMPPRFVGGHPMAGTEQSGCRASMDTLFENAFYILTGEKSDPDTQKVASVVEQMGALPVYMSAQEHDEVVASVSHLPHMIAYTLVNTVLSARDNCGELASGGFLDTTRIASSSPDFWLGVVRANKENVLNAMDEFIDRFEKLRGYIENNDGVRARGFFSDGKRRRDKLMTSRRFRAEYELYVPVRDEVGEVGRIASLLGDVGADLKSIRIDNSREGTGGALRLGFKRLGDYDKARKVLKENNYL